MGQLLEAIFSNPILLFLIIGGIMRYLQSGKAEETTKKAEKNNGPQKLPKKLNEIDWREIFRQELFDEKPKPKVEEEQSYSYTQPIQEDLVIERTNSQLKQYEKIQRNKNAKSNNDRKEVMASPIYGGDLSKNDVLNFKNMSKEDVVKGVIWSEVIGRPRSTNPYRTRTSLNIQKKA